MPEDEFLPVLSAKARKVLEQNEVKKDGDLFCVLNQRIKSLSHRLDKVSSIRAGNNTANESANDSTLEQIINDCKDLYSLTFNDFTSIKELESRLDAVKKSAKSSTSNGNSSKQKGGASKIDKDREVSGYIKYLEEEIKNTRKILDYRNQISKIRLKSEQLLKLNLPKRKPLASAAFASSTPKPAESFTTSRRVLEKKCILKIKIPLIMGMALSSKYWHLIKSIQDQTNTYISINNKSSPGTSTNEMADTTSDASKGFIENYSFITIKGSDETQCKSAKDSFDELISSMVIKKVPKLTDEESEEILVGVKNYDGPKFPGCLIAIDGELFVVGKKEVVEMTLDKIFGFFSDKKVQNWKIEVFEDDKFWELALQSRQLKKFNCKYSSGIISINANNDVFKSFKKEIDNIVESECCTHLEIEKYQANKLLSNGAGIVKYFQSQGATCLIAPDRLGIIFIGKREAVEEAVAKVDSLKKNAVKIGISSLRMPINPEHSKLIIGPNGVNIKRLIEQSGVENIKVERSDFPSVVITGDKEAVEVCKGLILEITSISNISNTPSENSPRPDTPPKHTHNKPKEPLDIGPDSFPSLTGSASPSALPQTRGFWNKPTKTG